MYDIGLRIQGSPHRMQKPCQTLTLPNNSKSPASTNQTITPPKYYKVASSRRELNVELWMGKRARSEEESAETTSQEVEHREATAPEKGTAVAGVEPNFVGWPISEDTVGIQRKWPQATWPKKRCLGPAPFGNCWPLQATSRGNSCNHVDSWLGDQMGEARATCAID